MAQKRTRQKPTKAFMAKIGAKGGRAKGHTGPFSTIPGLASRAGRLGGAKSKRPQRGAVK